jgi:hypothetical protein
MIRGASELNCLKIQNRHSNYNPDTIRRAGGVDEFLEIEYLQQPTDCSFPHGDHRSMYMRAISLLFHFIGIGTLFTTIIAGFILDGRYRKATDWNSKLLLLRLLRSIGLLSPLGVLIMLASGIANMEVSRLGVFTAAWLSVKLIFFTLVVISGILFSLKGRQRSALATKVAEGNAPEGSAATLRALDRQQRIFYVVQAILILIILALSIVRPTA